MSDCDSCGTPGFNQNPSGLPPVTSADNGDVLEVVGGVWAKAAAAPGTLPAVGVGDNDDLLAVVAGAWTKSGPAYIIRTSLADLVARDKADLPNGCQAYVIAEGQIYQLDTNNPLTSFSPLIITRGAGVGKWYRKSRAYVVGNFTLWCQSYSIGIVGYTPGQLLVSGATEPDIVLTASLSAVGGIQGVVADNLGNLWLSANDGTFSTVSIRKFQLKDCLASGAPAAQITLNVPVPGSTEAGFSAFDRYGGLWTNTATHGTFGISSFVRYGQKEYSNNNGIPTLNLTCFSPGLVAPSTSNTQDMVFDGQGNLWATLAFTGDAGGPNGGIIMFTPEQLQNGGSAVVPAVFWHGSNFTGTGLSSTSGIAIASNGFIWTTDVSGNSLRAWNPVGAVSGNPAASVILTCATFNGPYSIAFDNSGNLWVQNGNDNRLQRIPAASLTASGTVIADVIINPVVATLTSNICFPNNPDRSGISLSGVPISL